MALTFTPQDNLGSALPDFKLKSVDGNFFSRGQLPQNTPIVIMFICNHCPYVKAIEDRLIQLGHDLKKLNVPVIAICSNDPEEYPEDNFENLKKRWTEKKYSFPYLHDETQEVAKKFGAVCTPDFFVYDKNHKLAYRGRLDDSWKDARQVTRHELFEAVNCLAADHRISFQPTPSMGCNIKWRTL